MRNLYLSILFLLFFVSTKADISGYEMQLVNIKTVSGAPTDNYKWRLKIYGPVGSLPLTNNIGFTIYANVTNAVAGNFIVSKTNSKTTISFPESYCYPKSANNAIEIIVYESLPVNYDALHNLNNFYLSASFCCRAIGISNILGSSDNYGNTLTMDFPSLGSASVGRYNTSPEFKHYPSFYYEIGRTYVLDWSAIDVDGDSLNYSMVKPFGESTTKPFSTINYAQGFKSDSNIADGNPDFTINAKSGQVLYKPKKLGFYAINVKVDEYRKISGVPTKIGTTYREITFKVVDEINAVPILSDGKNRTQIIRDTIGFNVDYVLNLKGRDIMGDSLYMHVIPSAALGENLFNPNLYGAEFGYVGSLQTGTPGQDKVLKGDSVVFGQFKWKPLCKNARALPYKLSFVLRDRNCSDAETDSLHVYIYVRKKPNAHPMFISPDSSINNKVLKYYVRQNTLFQLNGDSILKTYDEDSTQVVNLICIPNPTNPSFNNFVFTPTPSPVHSFATFSAIYTCTQNTPYRYTFIAFDDDCLKRDSAFLSIEVYVLPEFVAAESLCGVTVDPTNKKNLIFWKRNDPLVSNYIIYKNNPVNAQFDSVGTIVASDLNAYLDVSPINLGPIVKYRIVSVNACGTRSIPSNEGNNIQLGGNRVSLDKINLTWTAYLNAEPNDSFIVGRAYCTNPTLFTEIARLPLTQLYYSDSEAFVCEVYHRIELKSGISCLGSGVTRPGIYSNVVLDMLESAKDLAYNKMQIYPNPTSDKIIISGLPENEENDLFIFDVIGKQVLTQKVQGVTEVDLAILNKGVYFVRVGATTRKLIKN